MISVHDGDTIRVRQGNQTERIRFACIDAPELKQPLGRDSRDHLKQLIANGGNWVALNLVNNRFHDRAFACQDFID